MIYLRLFYEFFKTGLFSVGGGMATIPFLTDIGEKTGWFTNADLMNMLAVSESTPGPIGINMATYVGFTVAGVPGGVIATLGEITPSIIVILIIAAFLEKFRNSTLVSNAFYGLRAASTGLIMAAAFGVIMTVLLSGSGEGFFGKINVQGLILAVVLFVLTNYVKPLKKLHPVVFIALSAVVGIVLGW